MHHFQPDVTVCLLRFGPYVDATAKPRFVGMRGFLKASKVVTHRTTGEVIVGPAVPFVINDKGRAELYLPHVDQPILSEQNFTYSVRWESGYGKSPESRTFSLPRATGKEQSYELLAPSSTVPGVHVPLEPQAPITPPPSTPSPSTGAPYIHRQNTPAASWPITHNLNKMPVVLLLVGGKLVYSDVEYPSNTQVTVTFPSPTSGEAHLV